VVDGRELDALVETLGGLLADPDRCTAMGEAGRRWVSDYWQWDGIAERLAELLAG
jgi:phosphatidylinositol alpha-1,6-mannosyltransferase